MGEQARVALQRSASPAALAAIVTSHSDIHDIGTVSPSISEPRQQQIQQIPLWMRWRKPPAQQAEMLQRFICASC